MLFTIPSSNKVQGQSGFMPDIDSAYAALAAVAAYNVQNTAYAGGAKGDGVTDDTAAIQAALTTAGGSGGTGSGGRVRIPPGTYLVSSPLSVPAGVRVSGDSHGSVFIKISGSFSGAAVFPVASAANVAITDLTIFGQSSTYSSNPACDGIQVTTSEHLILENLHINYVNGWGVQVLASGSSDSLWAVLHNVHTYQCNQGIHLLGTSGEGYNAGTYLTDCNVEQTAGGDGLLIEDSHDVTIVNLEGWNLSGSSGSTLHIKGNCQAVYMNGFDLGGLTGTTPQAHAVVLIESGTNGSPAGVDLAGGIIETGTPGLSVTAGTRIRCRGTDFFSNGTSGVSVTGSASPDVIISNCAFTGNGYTAGTNFDAVATNSNGITQFLGCEFLTSGGTGSQQVSSAVNATSTTYVKDCRFAGATAFGSGGGGFPKVARGNIGYNPLGPLTAPGVPASGTGLTSPFGVDATVFITGGTVSAIAVGGTATGLTSGSFRVPVGQTITLTYTAAPSWTWFGD